MISQIKKKITRIKDMIKVRSMLRSGSVGAYINNALYSKIAYKISGRNNNLHIGKGSIIDKMLITSKGDNHNIFIGNDCRIKNLELWFEDDSGEIIISNNTSIEGAKIAVTENNLKVIIGKDCMLSEKIYIRTGDSHSILDKNGNRINHGKSINIGEHVWIGADVTILKGVSIGNDSIIGAKSLVTNNISPKTIAAGVPAKKIKENISWMRKRI